jgi:glycosyltransferase involved in cell wall biosynthesis
MPDRNGKLKVAQFCDNYFPQVDGVVKVVHNYTKIMYSRGECMLVVPRYSKKYYYDDSQLSYKVIRKKTLCFDLGGVTTPLPLPTPKLTKQIKEFMPDIIHVHAPAFIGKYALRFGRRYHVPVVATFHSQYRKDIYSTTKSKLLTAIAMKIIMNFFNKCDEVWAPSKSSADILRSYGYKKYIHVMPNGTDFIYPSNAEELIENARNEYGIRKENKNLLYVGQIRYIKNLKLCFQAMRLLVKEDPTYHFYLVGEGMDYRSLKAYVKKHNLKENVHFLKAVKDVNKLAGIYGASDLFFFPSTYDTFSIVVREASVMKIPSLVTKDSNVAEPFIDGENGFIAEENAESMKNKIVEIFNDEEKRKKVGLTAAETIPITFETMVERTLERYQYIVNNYSKKRKL